MSQLALVLSAGGARGAYEAGVLNYIRTGLPKKYSKRNFDIQTGTSVGAINTAGMAAFAHDPEEQGRRLKELWFSIRQEKVYRRDLSATTHFLGSTVGGIMRNFMSVNPFKLGKRSGPHFNSIFDTSPLRKFLQGALSWDQLNKNVERGPISAVTIVATNSATGQAELFLKKKPDLIYQGNYSHHEGPITSDIVLASGAIPILFPTVKIGDFYYSDGGMRLFTPMSPAIQLGADKLLVIGLRKRRTLKDYKIKAIDAPKQAPTISDQMGRILNGLFLDRVQSDIEQLDRINTIVDASEKIFGKNYLNKLNQDMQSGKDNYKADIAKRGLRKIDYVEIQPSEFITGIFLRAFERMKKSGFKFSILEKTLLRIMDVDPESGSDLLSYITFYPEYIQELFDLGYEDARRRRQQLIDILED
ncbi:MAG: patatin-like phospholipase family protein [Deltaproteobacteria bacterium]|nr:patatin-like phospholipase family protein [Deltaproteobacteria bacterium]